MEYLSEKKPFFKANLHCHSTCSDGKMTPAQLKEAYMRQGYSVLAFTDHEHVLDHSDLTGENFLALNGCELAVKEFPRESTLKRTDMKVCHLCLLAKSPEIRITPCYSKAMDHFLHPRDRDRVVPDGDCERVYSAEGISSVIDRAARAGYLVTCNHPGWSLEDTSAILEYRGLFAVEIYNHSCMVSGTWEYSPQVLDALLRTGRRVFCTACDDNHNLNGFFPPYGDSFGGFVMINAPALNYAEIIGALERGDFYASSGPEIRSLVREGDRVFLKTSPAVQLALLTRGRRTEKVNAAPGQSVTEAEFRLREGDGYFRVTVTDTFGHRADSQGYPV